METNPQSQTVARGDRSMVLMFTDVVDSVAIKRRIGDVAYVEALQAHLQRLKAAILAEPGASVIKSTGDGLLARFATPGDAVRAALRMQANGAPTPPSALLRSGHAEPALSAVEGTGLEETQDPARHSRAATVGEGTLPLLPDRIGIHSGVGIETTDPNGNPDVAGLAVDMAARVMGLCEAGQILLTRAAFDDARQFVREHPGGAPTPSSADIRSGLATTGREDLQDSARHSRSATDVGAGAHPPSIQWMAHGPYLFKGSDDALEVFEVGTTGVAPLKAPKDSDKARRAVTPGEEAMYDWRPASGMEVPRRKGWKIDRKLGEGGFGEVWLARNAKTKEARVFKFCFDADRLRSFRRELTLFRLLREALGDRKDIARIYEVSLEAAPFYLESEYAPGGDLYDWAAGRGGIGTLSLETRLDMLRRIAEAVAAAHSVGVLHKDLKPSNVLMDVAEDGSPRPKLADFGIGILADRSRLDGAGFTIAGFTGAATLTQNDSSRTGTRLYSPPESMTNVRTTDGEPSKAAPFTAKGDVYALGVMLYQFIIGDLDRPLAIGWERNVEASVSDGLLRGLLISDIIDMVIGNPDQRIPTAAEVSRRIDTIEERQAQAIRDKLALHAAEQEILREKAEAELAKAQEETARAKEQARSAWADAAVGRGHEGPACCVVWCKMRNFILSGGQDGTIRVWKPKGDAGLELVFTARGHTNYANALAISDDDSIVVSAGFDNHVRRWKLSATGSLEQDGVGIAHEGPVFSLALCTRHKFAVSGGFDNSVRLWSLPEDGGIIECPGAYTADSKVLSVDISPDGRFAMVGTQEGTVALLHADSASGLRLLQSSKKRSHFVFSVRFSPDGKFAYTSGATSDEALECWFVDSAGLNNARLVGSSIQSMVFTLSVDGRWLATSAGRMKFSSRPARSTYYSPSLAPTMIDVCERSEDGSLAALGRAKISALGAMSLSFSPDAKWLASAGAEGVVRLWRLDGKGGISPAGYGEGHHRPIRAIHFLADEDRVVSAGEDHTLSVWAIDSDGQMSVIGQSHTPVGWVNSLCYSKQDRVLVASGYEGVCTWAGEELAKQSPAASFSTVKSLVGNLIMHSQDGSGAIAATGQKLGTISPLTGNWMGEAKSIREGTDAISCICRAEGRDLIAAAFTDGVICKVKVDADRDPICTSTLDAHNGNVTGIAYSASRKFIVSCGEDGTLKIWRSTVSGGLECQSVTEVGAGKLNCLSVAPNGMFVACGSEEGRVLNFELGRGGEIHRVDESFVFADEVTCLAFSERSDVLVAGGYEARVALWKVSPNGHLMHRSLK